MQLVDKRIVDAHEIELTKSPSINLIKIDIHTAQTSMQWLIQICVFEYLRFTHIYILRCAGVAVFVHFYKFIATEHTTEISENYRIISGAIIFAMRRMWTKQRRKKTQMYNTFQLTSASKYISWSTSISKVTMNLLHTYFLKSSLLLEFFRIDQY